MRNHHRETKQNGNINSKRKHQTIRNRIFLVLSSIILYSDLVKIVRHIEDTVEVSGAVKISIQRSLDEAEQKIRNDEQALKLMKRLDSEKEIDKTILMKEDPTNLDKLIDFGLVDMFLDNTVSLSGMGIQILGKMK
jgi:hypothetical protein